MKTTISSIVSAVSAFFMMIALAPPELQNQIPQLFPEAYRGRIALLFAIIAGIARIYQGQHTQDKLKESPSDTTTTTETVTKEKTVQPETTKP